VSFPLPLPLDPTGATAGAFPTPVLEIRAERDPFDMHWMVDLYVDGWTALTRPQLASVVLDAPGGDSHSLRASSDGVTYLNPRALVTPNERLEAQVLSPDPPIGLMGEVRSGAARPGSGARVAGDL
jgi:hypothetical protein